MSLNLRLKSSEKEIFREVEHRWTNALPFLFAFYVDGKAITIQSTGYGKMGGANRIIRLVESGAARTWELRLDSKSLRSLLPDSGPHDLCMIAAFSDRQHEGYFSDEEQAITRIANPLVSSEKPIGQKQVVVRSGVACLKWSGTEWMVTPARNRK